MWDDGTMEVPPTLPAESFGDAMTRLRRRTSEDQVPAPPEWGLVVYAGANLGRVFPLIQGENVIGRSPQAQITLLDDEVSRAHARVQLEQGAHQAYLHVEDLDSTNGTFLNGQALLTKRPVQAGDRISLGSHVLKLVALDPLERSFHQTMLEQSTLDPLTGLGNRGVTLSELQSRFELCKRHHRPLSIIMCDLDHFKRINDTHGHGAGDLVLKAFGERVHGMLRSADVAGRIGGEEFLLVLSETDLTGATLLAERIRAATESTPVLLSAGPTVVTCSLGVAERMAQDREAGVLLARADFALYDAKHAGRNRVVVASSNTKEDAKPC
jgi:diguanylate cyclase (GGDEF)-like protein